MQLQWVSGCVYVANSKIVLPPQISKHFTAHDKVPMTLINYYKNKNHFCFISFFAFYTSRLCTHTNKLTEIKRYCPRRYKQLESLKRTAVPQSCQSIHLTQ